MEQSMSNLSVQGKQGKRTKEPNPMAVLAGRLFAGLELMPYQRRTIRSLLDLAHQNIAKGDPSHDFSHAVRVLGLALRIAKKEGGNLLVVATAALFHDLIVYPKDSPKSRLSASHSAIRMGELLRKMRTYPRDLIGPSKYAVSVCSLSNGRVPETIEAKIVRDADSIEKSGVILIMRAAATGAIIQRNFFDQVDPLAENGAPNLTTLGYVQRIARGLSGHLFTKTAQEVVSRRLRVTDSLLASLREELTESGVL